MEHGGIISCDILSLHNGSNNGTELHNIPKLDYSLAEISKVAVGGTMFFLILPFVLFTFKRLPIGTTAAVLFGGFTMKVGLVLSQDDVYFLIGEKSHLQIIFLLLGMMLLTLYFEREEMLSAFLGKILRADMSFEVYIWWISVFCFVLSALFTNDACCTTLTPVLVSHWKSQKRPHSEIEAIVIAIATMCNIGSCMTVFGNPPIALIAAKTEASIYAESRLNLLRCLVYLAPSALLAGLINYASLLVLYKWQNTSWSSLFFWKESQNVTGINLTNINPKDIERNMNNTLGDSTATIISQSSVETSTAVDKRKQTDTDTQDTISKSSTISVVIEISIEASTSVDKFGVVIACEDYKDVKRSTPKDEDFSPSGSKFFCTVLIVMVLLVIALFFASTGPIEFDIGLVPMGAAIIILITDAIINQKKAVAMLRKVDWPVLMMFQAVFVWLGGLNATRLARWLWKALGLVDRRFDDFSSLAVLFVFVMVGSSLFSNIPLTLIFLEQVPPCENQLAMILYYAWIATLAGNVTLFGSLVNLIVADKSEEIVHYRMTFWRHLRFGFLTTLVYTTLGVIIIYLTLSKIKV